MDKQPFRDRDLLIPIGIGAFSILGILIALLIVYLDKPEVAASPDPTATPFKFLFLGTETLVPDSNIETPPPEELLTQEPTEPILITSPEIGFPTAPVGSSPRPSVSASVTPPAFNATSSATSDAASGATSSATPTIATPASNAADRLDDRDPLLEYDGDWVNETNTGAHQQTLTVSNEIGNDVIFSFVGQQIIIGYLGASGLGIVTIYIDDNEFQLNQSAGRQWVSPQFANEEHFVILIHEDGNSVNIDYIDILGLN